MSKRVDFGLYRAELCTQFTSYGFDLGADRSDIRTKKGLRGETKRKQARCNGPNRSIVVAVPIGWPDSVQTLLEPSNFFRRQHFSCCFRLYRADAQS